MREVIALEFISLFQMLSTIYVRIEPHHETWMLWLKEKSTQEIFEVAIGTILVQNTNWKNVDIAISNLFKENINSFEEILRTEVGHLEELIRPAGFYKQKARSLISLSKAFSSYSSRKDGVPSRKELINIKGVGKETADSLLVYCFNSPVPIVGTYTRRFFARIFGEIKFLQLKYEVIQELMTESLPSDYFILGKFHALIVSHSQQVCNKVKPLCENCQLKSHCTYGQFHKKRPELINIQNTIVIPKKAK